MAKPNFTLPNKPAIKSGSILSYNYTDDFTFVPAPLTFNRDSAATRVNEKGLIEDVGYFGPELVQNGDFSEIGSELVTNGGFDTDSDWVKGAGWSISDGKAISDGVSSNSNFSQNNILTLNKAYKVSVNVILNSGTLNVYVTSSPTKVITSSGLYTFYGVCDRTDLDLHFKSVNLNGSIDNVSVKEVGQNWTFGTGWSVDQANSKAVFDGGADAAIQQLNVVENGKKYKFKIDVNDRTSGNLQIRFGSTGSVDATIGSNGSYVYNFTSDGTTLYLRAISGFNGSITNISVVEVLGDKPRIDYSDSLTEPSLLLEPQSTNLLPYSEDFYGYRVASSTVTPNSTTAPDGTNSGVLVTQGTNQLVLRANNVISPSTTYTFSGYFKSSGSITKVSLDITDEGTQQFDLTNEWQRFSVTAQSKSTGSPYHFVDVTTNGLQGDTFYAWGLQVEQLSYPTSYIPTAGSTATRLGETATNAGDVNVFNSEEGVLYAEFSCIANDGETRIISLSEDGNTVNRINIFQTSGSNKIKFVVKVNSTNIFDEVVTLSNILNYNKIALSYKENEFKVYINGVKEEEQLSGSIYPANTLDKLNFDQGGGNYDFYGKVRNLQVFNKALTDRELEILTIQ